MSEEKKNYGAFDWLFVVSITFNLIESIGDVEEIEWNVKAASRQTTDFIRMIHLITNAMERRGEKENRLRNDLVDLREIGNPSRVNV